MERVSFLIGEGLTSKGSLAADVEEIKLLAEERLLHADEIQPYAEQQAPTSNKSASLQNKILSSHNKPALMLMNARSPAHTTHKKSHPQGAAHL